MDLKYLSYVIAIAQEGTLSAAARKLFMSQPNLSIYLGRLEQELGVQLFIRSENHYTPTPAGREYITSARKILEISESTDFFISELKELHHGTITIGMAPHTQKMLMPLFLPHWQKKFPNFKYYFVESNAASSQSLLLKHQLDLAVFQGGVPSHELVYNPLSREDFLIAAPKKYGLTEKSIPSPGGLHPYLPIQCLRDYPVILQTNGRLRDKATQLFYEHKLHPNVVVETGSITSANRLANAGIGCTFMTNIISCLDQKEIENLDIFLAEPYETPDKWIMSAVYHQDTYLKPVIDEIIRICRVQLVGKLPPEILIEK